MSEVIFSAFKTVYNAIPNVKNTEIMSAREVNHLYGYFENEGVKLETSRSLKVLSWETFSLVGKNKIQLDKTLNLNSKLSNFSFVTTSIPTSGLAI